MRQILFTIVITLLSAMSHAYTISPKTDIHESITRSAKYCFDKNTNKDNSEFKCELKLIGEDQDINTAWIKDSSIDSFKQLYKRMRGYKARFPTLEEAVRWPDDPTRQIKSVGIGKFAINMLTKCGNYVRDNRSGRNDVNDGLLCNSHNGEMQFFHAQASGIAEPSTDTYYKIKAWATFLYQVASGHLTDTQLDQPYCEYFNGNNLFHKSMLPNQSSVPCENMKDPKWTITTLFTLKCRNPFSSIGCKEEVGPSKYVKARIYAAGALLHLIQDSYSQSHSERGNCVKNKTDNKVVAKIECLPITMFTTYGGQIGHDEADRTPTFEKSCISTVNIDDPITASAKALWHISKRSPINIFIYDLEKVFGKGTSSVLSTIKKSDIGMCFNGNKLITNN